MSLRPTPTRAKERLRHLAKERDRPSRLAEPALEPLVVVEVLDAGALLAALLGQERHALLVDFPERCSRICGLVHPRLR
jgi:hypothetical protein